SLEHLSSSVPFRSLRSPHETHPLTDHSSPDTPRSQGDRTEATQIIPGERTKGLEGLSATVDRGALCLELGAMASKEKDLEDRLREVGSRLASPPSAVDELLPLLDQTESLLSRVDQSPTQSMSNALRPSMKALVVKELLGHSDIDVKVAVASCVSEITRITAPEAPYDDDLMKEVFQRIVEAFENLDDVSSRSFLKRVSVLETVAKVRSCVVMLDLECDSLIIEMFRHFLKTIRPNHSEMIFSSMETIMTLVLEESEDISPELILCLLDSVKSYKKDILPVARRLGEKVISKCAGKLKPYLVELSESTGMPLNTYGEVVASICQERLDSIEQNDIDDSKQSERTVSDELVQGSDKMEQEVNCPEEVTSAVKSPKSVMSNGTVRMVNGGSTTEPSSPKQDPEPSCPGDQSKRVNAANRDVSDSGAVKDALPAEAEVPVATRRKRGRPSTKLAATRHDGSAVAAPSASPLQQKVSEMGEKAISSKDSNLQKESDGITGPEDIEDSPIDTRDSEEKSRRQQNRKSSTSKTERGDSSQKSGTLNNKQRDNLKAKKDKAGEPILKETVSSLRSAAKSPKDQGNLEESAKTKFGRKREHGGGEISETPTVNKELDGGLVGSRIRVWWPMDKKFYDGVVDSYDHASKKHKIVYTDGDVEILLMKKERWEFVKDDNKNDMEQAKDSSNSDASSEEPKSKRMKTSSSSNPKETNAETATKSGKPSSSRRKGRPRKAGVLNLDDGPSSSSKANEKATSRSKDEGSKSDVKLKDDAKSTGDNVDKSTSKTGSQKKDNVHKFIRNSIDGTPKSAIKLMDDTVSAASKVRKDTSKSKSSEDNPKTGQKLRGTTSPTTGSESEANIDFEKGKAKIRESETLAELPSYATPKASESEASAGKKRKRRGQT
ncbi:PDS5, regulator of cohesion maintenance, partial [Musa troglodytarum]